MKIERTHIAVLTALALLSGCGMNNGQPAVTEVSEKAVTGEIVSSETVSSETVSSETVSSGELNNYNITRGGTYRFSGSSDTPIHIDAKNEDVVIILDNAQITSADSPALFIEKAKSVTVTAEAGTSNLLCCTARDNDGSPKKTAAVFGKTDLVLDGTGTAEITSEYGAGIRIKGDITAENGIYQITSADHGITADGNITLNNSKVGITAGGGYTNAAPRKKKKTSDKDSPKGITTDGAVSINGGSLMIDCSGDALNSDGDITISDGSIDISCGDDAIHSEASLTVGSGSLSIPVCYEGIEGYHVTVNGGDITIVSGDDGINSASSDTDSDTFMNGGDSSYIIVNGGNISVISKGDGFDTNGTLEINGGTINVKGPSGSDNSPFDHDGDFIINGGEVTGFGSGMLAVPPAESGKQPSVFISLNIPSGKEITVKDETGSTVLTFPAGEQCDNAVISSPLLMTGKTYSVYAGDSLLGSAEMNGTVAVIGTVRAGNGGGKSAQ